MKQKRLSQSQSHTQNHLQRKEKLPTTAPPKFLKPIEAKAPLQKTPSSEKIDASVHSLIKSTTDLITATQTTPTVNRRINKLTHASTESANSPFNYSNEEVQNTKSPVKVQAKIETLIAPPIQKQVQKPKQHASTESSNSPFSKNSLSPIKDTHSSTTLQNSEINIYSKESLEVQEKKGFSLYNPNKNSHASFESKNSPFYKVDTTPTKNTSNPMHPNTNNTGLEKEKITLTHLVKHDGLKRLNQKSKMNGFQDSIAEFQKFLKSESQRQDLY